jgi:hypothetical protein
VAAPIRGTAARATYGFKSFTGPAGGPSAPTRATGGSRYCERTRDLDSAALDPHERSLMGSSVDMDHDNASDAGLLRRIDQDARRIAPEPNSAPDWPALLAAAPRPVVEQAVTLVLDQHGERSRPAVRYDGERLLHFDGGDVAALWRRRSAAEWGLLYMRHHPLEEELGVVLFERTTRQLALTAAGEVLLEHGRRVLADTDRAVVAA